MSEVERVLMKFEKKLPSTAFKRLVVTKELVENPLQELTFLLEHGESRERRERYLCVLRREKRELRESIIRNRKKFPSHQQELLKGARINLVVNRVNDTGMELPVVLEEIHLLIERIKKYEESFFKDSGIAISFEDRALDLLLQRSFREGKQVEELCSNILKSYHHGLNLIREKNGNSKFLLPREVIKDPEGYLAKLIKASYGR